MNSEKLYANVTAPNCPVMRYHTYSAKVLPLDAKSTSTVLLGHKRYGYELSPTAGFTLEMKRKPDKYAFLYFLPSGPN